MASPLGGQDMFIKFDGIDGESRDAGHLGWSDANAFRVGASNDVSLRTGSGPKLVHEFVVSKPIDRSSPLLFRRMLTGSAISQVTFEAIRPDPDSGKEIRYVKYTLHDVRISSMTTGTTAETLTLQYGAVEEEYTPITAAGEPGTPVTRTLDRTLLGASIATTPGTASEVQEALQMQVRADGIDGESTAGGREDWIDGEGFGLCVKAPTEETPASFGDITVVKRVDAASPLLLDHAATGKSVPTVDIEICKVTDGGAAVCHLEYNLEGVLVTAVGTQTDPEKDTVTESVTLTFTTIEQTYTEFDESGGSKGSTGFGWDIETGTEA